jgi:hypothetical protein
MRKVGYWDAKKVVYVFCLREIKHDSVVSACRRNCNVPNMEDDGDIAELPCR